MRGNRWGLPTPQGRRRSIPACAGEPDGGQCPVGDVTVYPRVCGGTSLYGITRVAGRGLSPRVRGNHTEAVSDGLPDGSIPACAGEPFGGVSECIRWTVYPRVCGGTRRLRRWHRPDRGLSPRVRGNRPPVPKAPSPTRSIPACAGEPRIARHHLPGHQVYPRVCGGTATGRQSGPLHWGLSPRVRGNLTSAGGVGAHHRSIPACAGEPSPTRCR